MTLTDSITESTLLAKEKWLTETIPFTFLSPPSGAELREISKQLNLKIPPGEKTELEVAKEFARFFRVNGENYLPPYESCWILKPHQEDPYNAPRLYSKTTDEISEIMKQLGIESRSSFHEPPDHIAFELSLYFSLKQELQQEIKTVKEKFLKDHFYRWAPKYLNALAVKEGIFYPQVARELVKNM